MVVRCELKCPSLGITVRYHSASLTVPNSYSSDGIFNPHLTTIKDSFIVFTATESSSSNSSTLTLWEILIIALSGAAMLLSTLTLVGTCVAYKKLKNAVPRSLGSDLYVTEVSSRIKQTHPDSRYKH